MKIGILSMQRIVNFGSVLQAWSLRQMVREVTGTEPDFLDIDDENKLDAADDGTAAQDYAAAASCSNSIFQRGKRRLIRCLSAYNKRLIRRFMRNELGLDDHGAGHYDHVIIGSDEVFNHTKGVRLQLHGEVKQADHVITYAASCGTARAASIPVEKRPQIRRAMNNLAAVSVRDEGTKQYVSAFYDGPIAHHLDPVLVGELYARPRRKVWLKKYLLVYAYGQRIRTAEEIETITSFAKAHGLRTVAVGGSQYWCDLYIPMAPMRVLDWFAHAEYVVTDTFHGTIFSVITQRTFATLIRPSNVNKLTCLLRDLGLEQRCVEKPDRLGDVLSKPIDYEAVDLILAEERRRARQYLKEQLTDERGKDQSGS